MGFYVKILLKNRNYNTFFLNPEKKILILYIKTRKKLKLRVYIKNKVKFTSEKFSAREKILYCEYRQNKHRSQKTNLINLKALSCSIHLFFCSKIDHSLNFFVDKNTSKLLYSNAFIRRIQTVLEISETKNIKWNFVFKENYCATEIEGESRPTCYRKCFLFKSRELGQDFEWFDKKNMKLNQ